jgi:hypothetical protein
MILNRIDGLLSAAQLKEHLEFFDLFTKSVLISAVEDEIDNRRIVGKHRKLESTLSEYKSKEDRHEEAKQGALSIVKEVDLLREIKDAKEELWIIKRVLMQQVRIVREGLGSLLDDKKPLSTKKIDRILSLSCPRDKCTTDSSNKRPEGKWRERGRKRNGQCLEMVDRTISNNLRAVDSMLERAEETCEGVSAFMECS